MSIFVTLLIILFLFFCTYIISARLKYFHFVIENGTKIKNEKILISGGFFLLITIFLINFIHDFKYINFFHIIFSSLFFLIGFFDDYMNLSVFKRILLQFIISFFAFIFLFYNYEPVLEFYFFSELSSKIITSLIIIFFIVLFVNAFNFIDGIDGLAGTHAIIIFLLTNLIYAIYGNFFSFYLIFCIFFVFFVFIFSNIQSKYIKKIYLGNSGSFFLGSLLVLLTININLDFNNYHPFIILWLFSYPLFNLVRVVILRILSKKNPLLPDKKHFHHQLEKIIRSHFLTTLILSIIYLIIFMIGYFSTIYFIPELNLIVYITTFIIYYFSTEYYVKKFNLV